MKLNQNQINNYLSKSNNPDYFYWLNCEDSYLLQDNLKKIKKFISLKLSNPEKIIFYIDSSTDWQDIQYSLSTPNLFSSCQIIELHFISKLNITQQKELISLAENANKLKNTICIAIYPFRIESKTLKAKWMSSLDSNGVVITIWPPNNTDYPNWLRTQCAIYKMNITDKEAFDYFCQKTMGNPSIAAQALYKLRLQNITTPTLIELSAILDEHASYNIFDLVDSYLLKNIKQSFIILKNIKRTESNPELLILWSLRKELLLLAEILEQAVSTNTRPQTVLQEYNLWQNKKNIIQSALNHFNLDLIYKSLHKIADIEVLVKTQRTEYNKLFIWQNIEQLLLLATNMEPMEPLDDTA